MRTPRLLPALVAAGLLGSGVAGGSLAIAAPAPAPRAAQALAQAVPVAPNALPADGWTNKFRNYGNRSGYSIMCDEWTGGDGTHSVALGGGKRLWTFSDTYLGDHRLRKDGLATSVINNSMIMENNGSLAHTITGGNTCRERAEKAPGSEFGDYLARTPARPEGDGGFGSLSGHYWNADAMKVGDRVISFWYRQATSTTAWTELGWGITSTPVAEFNKTELHLRPQEQATRHLDILDKDGKPTTSLLTWGTALVPGPGNSVFIYGRASTDGNFGRQVFLAKVDDKATLATFSSWKFWTGKSGSAQWSNHQNEAVRLGGADPSKADDFDKAHSNFSVIKRPDGKGGENYWLVTHELSMTSGDIRAYGAANPWGFRNSRGMRLHQPPEGRMAKHDYVYHYDARVHEGLGGAGRTLISYNVNTAATSIGCGYRSDIEPDLYRPRFITVSDAAFTTPFSVLDELAKDPDHLKPDDPGHPSPATAVSTASGDNQWYRRHIGESCPVVPDKTTVVHSAVGQPDGSVRLSWTDYGRDMWYWVWWRRAGTTEWTRVTMWAPTNSTTHQPLYGGSAVKGTFEYRVQPFPRGNSLARSLPYSAPKAVSVQVQKPTAPTGVTATSPAPGEGWVRWSSVTYPSSQVYYRVFYWDVTAGQTRETAATYGQSTGWIEPFIGDFQRYHFTGLTRGHKYGFSVKAENNAGASAFSANVFATP